MLSWHHELRSFETKILNLSLAANLAPLKLIKGKIPSQFHLVANNKHLWLHLLHLLSILRGLELMTILRMVENLPIIPKNKNKKIKTSFLARLGSSSSNIYHLKLPRSLRDCLEFELGRSNLRKIAKKFLLWLIKASI